VGYVKDLRDDNRSTQGTSPRPLVHLNVFRFLKNTLVGANEFKRAKINVKRLIFLQFLLHLSIWSYFSGM